MTTETLPASQALPTSAQASAVFQSVAQDALTGVLNDRVNISLDGRRVIAPADVTGLNSNVLFELQFERPLNVQHSLLVLSDAGALTALFKLAVPEDETEILSSEALLTLGDVVSTFLDTLVPGLTWLQPSPRAWLANLEPVAVDETGNLAVVLPGALAGQEWLELVEVTLNAGSETCPLQIIFSEETGQALLGLDAAGGLMIPAPAPAHPGHTAASGAQHDTVFPQAAMAAQQAPVQGAQFPPLGGSQGSGRSSSIDLIKDVPLRVSVELGRTSLTVRDILGLGVGSVVALDRLAGEPVDVLVNERLIARGEVVIVDESFGVRITEIVREPGRRATL